MFYYGFYFSKESVIETQLLFYRKEYMKILPDSTGRLEP